MNYKEFSSLARHNSVLKSILSLLDWDQETYMPRAATAFRAEQMKTIASLAHQEKQSEKWKNGLSMLQKDPSLNSSQKSAVSIWVKESGKVDKIPLSFVEEFTSLTSESVDIWQQAKKENNFPLFAPYLQKIVDLCRKKSDLLGWKEHPYDPLLDEYEPDMTTAEIDETFKPLREALSDIITKIPSCDDAFLHQPFSQEKQMTFGKQLLEGIGFDFNRGRIDESAHPFSSTQNPHDTRITTRISPKMLISHLRSCLHEAGHSFYDMGLPEEHFGTPLGHAISLGMHESQSRLWETQVGLSRPFWIHFYPKLIEAFPSFDAISLDQFLKAINKVEPSFIRVEADEVTYGLHVILRFELEKALIEGSLKVKDLPEAWNQKMKDLLGITPKTDREGCLQDIHWAGGSFGYFPTYTLGNLWAAELFAAYKKEHPDWENKISAGDFSKLHEWLSENVWKHGQRYSSKELIKKVTGHSTSSKAFLDYLHLKHLV